METLCMLTVLVLVIHNIYGQNITISTLLGDVTGIQQDDYVSFRGIPYTEYAPIGNYRFTEMVPRTSLYANSPLQATSFGHACMQSVNDLGGIDGVSEDCLFLNIWTPQIDGNGTVSDELLPVMVWIHGGGFVTGSSSQYYGKPLMRNRNIIYVSIDYRLGALGFLATNTIKNETNGLMTGGMNGMNDQIVALQWIQANIADYGGDPNLVTISGESAGGFSVCYLSMISKASGLFDQGIIQSGHCSPPYAGLESPEEGISASLAALEMNGLTDNLTELRALNASKFVGWQSEIGPSCDGYLFTESPHDMLLGDNFTFNMDKVIIGSTSFDTLITWPFYITALRPPIDDDEFDGYMTQYVGSDNLDILKNTYYPISDFPSFIYTRFISQISQIVVIVDPQTMRWGTINSDVCFKCSTFFYLQKLTDNAQRLGINSDNLYLYDFIGPQPPNYIVHGGDFPYLFYQNDTEIDDLLFTFFHIPKNENFSTLMDDIWTNFVSDGIPNSSLNTEQWISYGMNRTGMEFGRTDVTDSNFVHNVMNFDIEGYRNGVCDFWLNEMGWDVISNLCAESYSLSPTTSPTLEPTPSPTTNEDTANMFNLYHGLLYVVIFYAMN